ncbi:MAG: hypothetical protein WCP43_06115, partial [Dehalococcoidia bacterium]
PMVSLDAATGNCIVQDIGAYFAEIGRLFGMKTAGCSGKPATPLSIGRHQTKAQFNLVYYHLQTPSTSLL